MEVDVEMPTKFDFYKGGSALYCCRWSDSLCSQRLMDCTANPAKTTERKEV